jgi:UDP-N-acetyl-D-galactosamine dehydrogenase
VADIIKELKSYSVNVEVIDPHASSDELMHEYGFGLTTLNTTKKYEAVIVAVNHKEYKTLDEAYFKNLLSDNGVLVDLKGMYRHSIKELTYWSL